jgi:hypothetical protein
MSRVLIPLATFGIILALLFAFLESAHADQNNILAINIALNPDAAMIQQADAANAQLLKVYPQGFALGASHKPHITLLQRYVRAKNLSQIYAALDKVLASEKLASWKLKATHYDFTPWNPVYLLSISVEPNDKLINLQQKLINAIAPFTEKSGTASAFVTTPEEPAIDNMTVNYVTTFVPERTGTNFNPHVTIGLTKQADITGFITEPLRSFTFSPVAVSVYQIGHFGTARKQLKAWH